MTEWKLFEGAVPFVSTPVFHAHRERARHLEQPLHQPRLQTAARLIRDAPRVWSGTFSDLGCGDGGLLSIVQDTFYEAWGYDFQPSNAAGWAERGVTAFQLDVFGADRDKVKLGLVVGMTEVLEHLADPHGVLKWLHASGAEDTANTIVCSSPSNEFEGHADECHAWAWDLDGYADLVTNAGWRIIDHEEAGLFQVIRAVR